MKNFIINIVVLAVLSLGVLDSKAQQLRVSTGAEKTIMGLQPTNEVVYEFDNYWSMGGFYQRNLFGNNESNGQIYEFTGLKINFPIAYCDNLLIKGGFRGGLSNRRFVVVVPQIETEIYVGNVLALGFGMSLRASEAAISAKVILDL